VFLKQTLDISKDSHAKFKISEFKNKQNPKAYLFEVFKDFGFTEWNDVLSLLDAQSGKQVLSEQWRLIKDRDYLLLSEIHAKSFEKVAILEIDKNVEAPFGTLYLNEVNTVSETAKHILYVDKNKLHFPLILRTWEEG